jgi:hypothetical protein
MVSKIMTGSARMAPECAGGKLPANFKNDPQVYENISLLLPQPGQNGRLAGRSVKQSL